MLLPCQEKKKRRGGTEGERKKGMKKLTNREKTRATGISVWRKHMGMKHPPGLGDRRSRAAPRSLLSCGCHQLRQEARVQACVCPRGPAGTDVGGRVFQEALRPADSGRGLATAAPPHGASAQRDSALTHRAFSGCLPLLPACLPAGWLSRCFRQSRTDFTAFES